MKKILKKYYTDEEIEKYDLLPYKEIDKIPQEKME